MGSLVPRSTEQHRWYTTGTMLIVIRSQWLSNQPDFRCPASPPAVLNGSPRFMAYTCPVLRCNRHNGRPTAMVCRLPRIAVYLGIMFSPTEWPTGTRRRRTHRHSSARRRRSHRHNSARRRRSHRHGAVPLLGPWHLLEESLE